MASELKVNKGSYGRDTIESNSLVSNLIKYPEISKALIRQFPQYSLTYFLEGTGRFAKEVEIGDKQFRWFVQGRLNQPSTATGTSSGTGVGNAIFSVEFEENFFNPYDVVRFQDGTQAIVIGEPTASAGGFNYNFRLETSSATDTFASGNAGAGKTANTISSAFPEFSEKGFENHRFPDEYTNFLTTTRKAKSISGGALTDITWIENNSQRLWYFTDQTLVLEEYLYQLELSRWYGKRTVDLTGATNVVDEKGRPITTGDGLLTQIDTSNIDTYTGTLTEKTLTDFLANLGLNTGRSSNHWLVYTGTAGLVAFHEAMKDLAINTGQSVIYDYDANREIEIGVHYTTYHAIGHRMTLVHNPLFDDPNLHTDIDPDSGSPKESFRMVFLDFGTTNGVSNIEVAVKGAGGINRGMIIKYIPGMVNPFDPKTMTSSNARDGFTCEVLSESGLIIRNPLSCGQLLKA